jgi:hypothetical protein
MLRMILTVGVCLLVVGVSPVMAQRYGNMPLAFEPNQGQSDSRVKFLSRGGGYTVFLTETGAVLTLDDAAGSAVRVALLGAAPARVNGTDPLSGHSNYIIGNDPRRWQLGVPQFAKVRYNDIYPGIDLLFYGNQRQLEYDFIVSPRRRPSAIRLAIDGAQSVRLNSNGDLVLGTRSQPIRMQRPIAYQDIDGTRRPVAVRYRLMRGDTVGFDVGRYDTNAPLVIDPLVLVHSSYLGGFGWDEPNDMALDAAGNTYVTGLTEGRGFPVTEGGQLSASVGSVNAFVTKIDASGTSIVYSTIFGGTGFEGPGAIAVDAAGGAIVAGGTTSADFPTVGGVQTGLRGTADGFIVKLAPSGTSFVYSTLFGGSAVDEFTDLAVAASGEVYAAGTTLSDDLPVRNAVQPSFAGATFDMFVVKFNADASEVMYATYLGGSGDESGPSLTVDSAGNAFIVGATRSADFPTANALQPDFRGSSSGGFYPDAFITKLSPDGSSFVYSTYLGGMYFDTANDVAVDASGNAYIVGSTDSWDFPRVGGIPRNYSSYHDAFITKVDSSGSGLVFSTTLGGSDSDGALRVTLDATGDIWVAGSTASHDLPVKSPFQGAFAGGWDDGFVAKLNPDGSSLLASTYFGGSGRDYISGLAIDAAGSVLVSGATSSTDLPTLDPFQAALAATPDQQGSQGGQDAFLAKLTWEETLVLTANAGPDQIVAANEWCSGGTMLNGSASAAPPDRYIWAYVWSGATPVYGDGGPMAMVELPALGTYTFDLTIYDDWWQEATDSVNVTLADVEPPRVGGAAVTPAVLWPPNRQMVPVAVSVVDVSDACGSAVTCQIEFVTGNEALAPGDWAITGSLTVQLRAHRLGDGTGRIYTIAIACTDAAGNTTRTTVDVVVPHAV